LNSVPSQGDIWERGRCHNHPEPDIFYPDRDATTYGTVAAKAKAICRGGDEPCPVILECLFYGLVTEDPFGIWGGLSARERNALRRLRSLDKYRSVAPLRGTRYWELIENYLEQHADEEEASDQSEDEGILGGEEA
jgi:WhiB family redox-sensing transcriptional regulator